jgi:Uma2 family endonuclease
MAPIYGGGGIPAYWIVNVADRQLEVYSSPAGGAYLTWTILGETESVDLIIDGQVVGRIAVADLLPKRA